MEVLVSIATVVFAVLNIILFFKLWGMTNNVAEILKIIERSDRIVPPVCNVNEVEKKDSANGAFTEGQVVVNLKNEDQLKISAINPDGTFSCVKNGSTTFAGNFKAEEIADFDAYWASKKR